MRTIWKFPIEVTDVQLIEVKGRVGRLLKLGSDPFGRLSLWAVVDTEGPPSSIRVHVVGTGNPLAGNLPDDGYVSTVLAGDFVWHVFAEVVR